MGLLRRKRRSITDDAAEAAEWIATALTSSGYQADFSPPSLWEIDRFFEEHSSEGEARSGGLLSEDLGSRLFALGAYTGEVIRRDLGGVWAGDDDDPEAEINIELRLPDGSVVWPIQRAMKRYANGDEDAIAPFAGALGANVGARPARTS